MTLLDRIARTNSDKFPGHTFEAIVIAYCKGHITQTKAYNDLNINGTSQERLDQQADFEKFKTKYDSFATNQTGRQDAGDWIDDVIILTQLYQEGFESKTQYDIDLGNLGLDTT